MKGVSGDKSIDQDGGTHGSAFLVGEISALEKVSSYNGRDRFLVKISRYALIDVPNFWDGSRNPVRYLSEKETLDRGIQPNELEWLDVPQDRPASSTDGPPEPMTIGEAKRLLAETLGIHPSQIEITIRA